MPAALKNPWLWGVSIVAIATVFAATPLCTVGHDDLVASLDFRPMRAEAELEPAALVRVEPSGRVAETLCAAPVGAGAATVALSQNYTGINYWGRAMPRLAVIGDAIAGTSIGDLPGDAFSKRLDALFKRHLPDDQLNAAVGRLMDTDPGCSDTVRRHLDSGAFVCSVRAVLLGGDRHEKIGLQLASLCLAPANTTAPENGTPPPPPLGFWPGVRRTLELVEYHRDA